MGGQGWQRADQVSIYGNFLFAPALLLLIAAAGTFRRRSNVFVFNCSLGCGLLLAVVIYFLVRS
ncbi:hypothetical protein MUN84_09100 [Hymenobacter sp. 5516J-16]|uniref:hypothetical protein n=1 Tax=Hymenobacter sp. 5516J-16 TaxID=2932253 RepID=UPI001FD423A8|nr:hypothetical protein [Hymenobacter sp. 5516J-16]UOQ78668.1 hypothetical protein MUN84_09100 [Hymenobacter sp. 5516J-16]